MLIEDLLTEKSRQLFTIEQKKTVEDAIAVLADKDIGALPACDATGKMVGIISERDIVGDHGHGAGCPSESSGLCRQGRLVRHRVAARRAPFHI